jgi:ADP-ribosyl-[dinitrogen reductase] hydrolase
MGHRFASMVHAIEATYGAVMEAPDAVDLANRYAGVLLGLACGDALGGPVEFQSRDAIAARYPTGLREFVGGGWLNLAPGEVTDDTQLTLALCRALGADGLDLDALAAEFIAWYDSGPKDIGHTTRAALAALKAGTPPTESGEAARRAVGPGKAASNGAVMRCAPVALRFRGNRQAMGTASLASARVTHAESRAAWGTVAVNQAITHLVGDGSISDLPAAATEGIDEPEVRAAVLAASTLAPVDIRANGFVIGTLRGAFWALLAHDDAESAIVAAVGLGDDTDTTGAVAGALAGARYGKSGLPIRWLDALHRRSELEAESARLLALAQ